jgi:regulator of protease activity HflC (stomatin/prohibitin superfamily)
MLGKNPIVGVNAVFLEEIQMVGIVLAVIAAVIVLVVLSGILKAVRIVQQGFVGVITRFGEFKDIKNPGLTFIIPFIEVMKIVDVRETPRTGDRQQVITRDNVAVIVNATIFSQVVDVRLALFTNSDYLVSVDNLARTSVRAVFGSISLDEAFSQREQISTLLQTQMEEATDKWGVRINRVEVLEITPPEQILQAMALQKQADQEKRAKILESEGQQQSAVNVADGQRQAAIKEAEGAQQAAILRAEGQRQALILEAEGRAQAIASVYAAIKLQQPDSTLVAILQLDTLSKFAESPNTKLIIPAESAALLGAAQAIKSVMDSVPVTAG